MKQLYCVRMRVSVAALLCFASASACVKHISTYEPKHRQYELPVDPNTAKQSDGPGSLWNASQPTNYIFSDQRALLVSDVVTVNISEESSAFSDANTKLESSSETKFGIDALFGFLKALQKANPNFDPTSMISSTKKNNFDGAGSTSRSGKVKAIVPALVRKVLNNGNLFIEGHRVILVNDEEYHFYISGVVRSIDIDQTNSVDSSKIADAEIEFTGRGIVTEKQQPGWLARALDWIWPF
jgi:flagellar L-ring protein precursor FlgH